ncbi:MAG: ATP-dependent helicase, partial [Bacteroidales bacterium]|nr:ATP-dependent helicase [Bacteroidales bacterium]
NIQSTIGTDELFLEKPEPYNKEMVQPELNSKQTLAVNHLARPALVLAGPGTGKTKVLVQRIFRLVNRHNINPKSILAVTFTNKAAGEMKERLQGLSGENNGDELTVSTFHALGYQIIVENLKFSGRRKQFSIINEDDKTLLLTHHLGVAADKGKEISEQIAYIKQQIDDFSTADNYLTDTFHRYNELLKKYNLFDLQDLIYLPVKLLSQHPEILSRYQDQYPWILVDEYQDINYSQYALLKLLAPGLHSNIFVIGDPDQAIYGFRGANVQYIKSFIRDYPDAATYKLTQSYRCSDTILKASHEIIKKSAKNSGIHGLNEGVKINITENATEKSEAEFVARTIERMMGGLRFFSIDSEISTGQEDDEITSLSEFAVLCRVSKQMEAIKKAFHDHSIPYQTVHETAFFQQHPVSTVIDMIKLSFNLENILLKHKLINNDKLKTLHMAGLNQIINHYPLDEAISHLIKQLFKDPSLVNDEKIKNLILIAKRYSNSPDKFLRFVSLGSGIDIYERNLEKVSLMTIHAAKGLEFKAVFIIGCEEGLIPYSLFKEHRADPEEEQRLLYVGMTRAMRYLWLTFAKKRFIWGKEYHLTRSHFLDQIEKKLIRLSKTTSGKKLTKPNEQLDLFS